MQIAEARTAANTTLIPVKDVRTAAPTVAVTWIVAVTCTGNIAGCGLLFRTCSLDNRQNKAIIAYVSG